MSVDVKAIFSRRGRKMEQLHLRERLLQARSESYFAWQCTLDILRLQKLPSARQAVQRCRAARGGAGEDVLARVAAGVAGAGTSARRAHARSAGARASASTSAHARSAGGRASASTSASGASAKSAARRRTLRCRPAWRSWRGQHMLLVKTCDQSHETHGK